MRLFISIALPKNIKQELAKFQKQLMQSATSGRYVSKDNFHLTLHFIGECKDLSGVVAAIAQCVRGLRPFSLHLGQYSYFDRSGKKTAYITLCGDLDELNSLYESLQSAMSDYGFRPERKQFKPHITLARNVEQTSTQAVLMQNCSLEGSFLVNAIHLYESRQGHDATVYTSLHRQPI